MFLVVELDEEDVALLCLVCMSPLCVYNHTDINFTVFCNLPTKLDLPLLWITDNRVTAEPRAAWIQTDLPVLVYLTSAVKVQCEGTIWITWHYLSILFSGTVFCVVLVIKFTLKWWLWLIVFSICIRSYRHTQCPSQRREVIKEGNPQIREEASVGV